MERPDVTIVAPWLSDSDWTGIILSDLTKSATKRGYSFNVIIGSKINSKKKTLLKGSFSFLYPKLKVVEKIIDYAERGLLADKIVLIDSSFINIKAIRYIVGKQRKIFCFVNGGAFQDHDLDCQNMMELREDLLKFENGHYSLIDKIFLPSNHALKLFLAAYPNLKNKTFHGYYFLPADLKISSKFIEKGSCLFPARQSFEKGFDIIKVLNEKGTRVDMFSELKNSIFRKKLGKYKSILIPARAELFGFCSLEAILVGTIPIIPKGFSYEELIYLPDEMKLSCPVGDHSIAEAEIIIKYINSLSESEYADIITQAKSKLLTKLHDKKHDFESVISEIFL